MNPLSAGLRALQLIFAILVLGLVGNMIAESRLPNHPSLPYTMAISALAILTVAYLIASALVTKLPTGPRLRVALDTLNATLFFIGGVTLAAYIGTTRCSKLDSFAHNPVISGPIRTGPTILIQRFAARGFYNPQKRCRLTKPLIIALWLGFASFLASLLLAARGFDPDKPKSGDETDDVRTEEPAMSQVRE